MSNILELLKPSGNDLPKCDPQIYKYGTQIAVIVGGSARLIERFIGEAREVSGQPIDWHYVGGRGLILTTGDIDKVRNVIERLALRVEFI